MPSSTVSAEFLLWTELCVLWSIFSYAITADPLPEDRDNSNFSWKIWRNTLAIRIIGMAILGYLTTHSIIMCSWLATVVTLHPWMRFRSPLKWTAELEVLVVALNLSIMLALVRHFSMQPRASIPIPLLGEHLSVVSIVGATLLFVVRGGTYVVRGCLRKAGTFPHISTRSIHQPKPSHVIHESKPPGKGALPSTSSSTHSTEIATEPLDVSEINRGRLIGNLERLILTIVVAAGSYAALAFLVAAKGLIRSEELQNRDFAEYFLVGSLSSALVALCCGIAIRIALLALWPQLLSLQMQ
jgi:hypothetical protein